ncbi:RRP15-like protein [Mytilus edulis]|uniref:RRP15-like protein n=1 Tax=Mytilus edulis TaxID=6550 RepID=A0A8S3TPG0_MYTED|nr:RRP15-like protein [Mytilus edulis]
MQSISVESPDDGSKDYDSDISGGDEEIETESETGLNDGGDEEIDTDSETGLIDEEDETEFKTGSADEEDETESKTRLAAGGEEEVETDSKKGLADAMAKILSKSVPLHKQVILAKGTTDRKLERKRKKKEEEDDEKHEDKTSLEKKRLWEQMAKIKPDPLERDKERALQRIAQRGVVQLFNAVRKQQKILKEQLDDAGPTEAKKSKALGKMTKGKFLDLLKGQTVANVSNQRMNMKTEIKQVKNCRAMKNESDEEGSNKKKWDILRDDYMMGAKMKDWDKESDSENPQSDNEMDSGSDSG